MISSPRRVLCHGFIFVCHWLCQCDGKVCSLLEKDTGRASGTPPEFFVVTKHEIDRSGPLSRLFHLIHYWNSSRRGM